MTISKRTEAELIEAAEDAYTHASLDLLFLRLEVSEDDQVTQALGRSKVVRLRRAIHLLREDDRVMDFARELIEEHYEGRVEERGSATKQLRRLLDALRIDGFELAEGHLVATTPGPASLADEITALERALRERRLDVAATHYRQAVDSFVDGRKEASNGQLRSALESALLEVCLAATGKRAADPRGAADRLRNANLLDGDETSLMKGLVGISNTKGAHAGLSDDEEALFRLHFTTAAVRYLLQRVP